MKKKPLSETISQGILTISPLETIENLWKHIRNNASAHFIPVVENSQIVGVVHRNCVEHFFQAGLPGSGLIHSIMNPLPFIVRTETKLKDVVQEMSKKSHECAIIVDSQEELQGIFTFANALNVLTMVLRTSPEICRELDDVGSYIQASQASAS